MTSCIQSQKLLPADYSSHTHPESTLGAASSCKTPGFLQSVLPVNGSDAFVHYVRYSVFRQQPLRLLVRPSWAQNTNGLPYRFFMSIVCCATFGSSSLGGRRRLSLPAWLVRLGDPKGSGSHSLRHVSISTCISLSRSCHMVSSPTLPSSWR